MISNFNIDFLIPAEVFVSRNGYLNPHQSVFYSVKFRRNKTRRTVVIAIDTKQLEASQASQAHFSNAWSLVALSSTKSQHLSVSMESMVFFFYHCPLS